MSAFRLRRHDAHFTRAIRQLADAAAALRAAYHRRRCHYAMMLASAERAMPRIFFVTCRRAPRQSCEHAPRSRGMLALTRGRANVNVDVDGAARRERALLPRRQRAARC